MSSSPTVSPAAVTTVSDEERAARGGRMSEQYRSLRAVIEASDPASAGSEDESLVVLVVGVEHGVADVGIRLAAAFADGGHETLLLDADLRSPACHRLLQTDGPPPSGLLEWLREPEERALPVYPSSLKDLSVLPAGRGVSERDPLQRERVDALMAAARAAFRRVVVVASPVALSADALFLAPVVDGVVVAVVPGKTGGPAALRARDSLLATGARIYGAVIADGDGR